MGLEGLYQSKTFMRICLTVFVSVSFLEGNKRFVLYVIDLFFVEVEYDNTENRIINKRAFVSGEILDKYSGIIR